MQARQEPVEFPLHKAVAFARTRFETLAIEHADVAAAVMDQAVRMQLAGGFRDAFAAHAEHVGNSACM